jgi:hypothetical protein
MLLLASLNALLNESNSLRKLQSSDSQKKRPFTPHLKGIADNNNQGGLNSSEVGQLRIFIISRIIFLFFAKKNARFLHR